MLTSLWVDLLAKSDFRFLEKRVRNNTKVILIVVVIPLHCIRNV